MPPLITAVIVQFFSTPPLPCDLSELPVVYKEEVADPAALK
jgi:cyclin-dependent kinase 12/13